MDVKSFLTDKQEKIYTKIAGDTKIVVFIRHDDSCKNGHNTFSITVDSYEKSQFGRWKLIGCGCQHELVKKYFPKLKKYLKWHLCSTDGPIHYIENALYWAGYKGWCDGGDIDPPNSEYLKTTVIFKAVPKWDTGKILKNMSELDLTVWLENRLPDLLKVFKKDVKELGFKY